MTHNQIPQVFGMSKIKMLRGEDADDRHQRRTRGRDDMSFSIEEDMSSVQMRPPSFNVLYVQTPRVGLLATPQFQMLAQTWQETVELVRPLFRFGFPETSLQTKCPYYNENLHATSAGTLLAHDRLRKVMTGIQRGDLQPFSSHTPTHSQGPQEQQATAPKLPPQQQPQETIQYTCSDRSSTAQAAVEKAYGPGDLGLLDVAGSSQQHMFKRTEMIPKSNMLVPDIPSGTLVLALNLMAYWIITKQSKRGF